MNDGHPSRWVMGAWVAQQGDCHGRSRQAVCPGCAALSRRIEAISIEIDLQAAEVSLKRQREAVAWA